MAKLTVNAGRKLGHTSTDQRLNLLWRPGVNTRDANTAYALSAVWFHVHLMVQTLCICPGALLPCFRKKYNVISLFLNYFIMTFYLLLPEIIYINLAFSNVDHERRCINCSEIFTYVYA